MLNRLHSHCVFFLFKIAFYYGMGVQRFQVVESGQEKWGETNRKKFELVKIIQKINLIL